MICLAAFALSACAEPTFSDPAPVKVSPGFAPNIVVGSNAPEDVAVLKDWITQSIALMTSDAFEANLLRAANTHPEVWISRERDTIPTLRLLDILHTRDNYAPHLWWPETSVVLTGVPAIRSPDQSGFGFEGARNAGAGPAEQGSTRRGEIKLGRLHFARFARGGIVERSCAFNTMTHEISHTLSDRPDQFWMHILDTGDAERAPVGMYEASYLIGAVAQCTWLQSVQRIDSEDFETCLRTFSDPTFGSRFRSRACDNFPDMTPLSPETRMTP